MLRAAFTSRSWTAPQPARPRPDVQRQLRRGAYRRPSTACDGEPAVDRRQFAAVPGGLVLQHGAQLPPGRVADGAGQPAVLDHVAHGQVLDHDRLVLTNEPSGQLVQVVPAPVGDPGVDAGDLAAGPWPGSRSPSPCGPGPAARGPAGRGRGARAAGWRSSPRWTGSAGGRARRPARLPHGGGRRGDRVLAQQRHEPAPGRVLGHGHRRRARPLGQRPRPARCPAARPSSPGSAARRASGTRCWCTPPTRGTSSAT